MAKANDSVGLIMACGQEVPHPCSRSSAPAAVSHLLPAGLFEPFHALWPYPFTYSVGGFAFRHLTTSWYKWQMDSEMEQVQFESYELCGSSIIYTGSGSGSSLMGWSTEQSCLNLHLQNTLHKTDKASVVHIKEGRRRLMEITLMFLQETLALA